MKKVLYMFSELIDEDIDWMSSTGVVKKIASEELLIAEGDIVPAIYIVLSGQFSVKNRFLLAQDGPFTLTSGDIVGEMSFVDGRPSSASVQANSDCKVLSIPKKEVNLRIISKPDFAGRFFKSIALFLSLRLRSTTGGMMISSKQEQISHDPDELDEDLLDDTAVAAIRYERLCAATQ